MGQKVNPVGLRVGIIRTWESKWYAKKRDYAPLIHEDLKVKKQIKKLFSHADIGKIEIHRKSKDDLKIIIHTAKPGVIIGRGGQEINELRQKLSKQLGKVVTINIQEIKDPMFSATLVARSVADQIERRFPFRRAMKKTVEQALASGVKGIKICCAGRLGGSEIARTEWQRKGRVPLHTLRADIDFAIATALTDYGQIGVKVWLFRDDIINPKDYMNQLVVPEANFNKGGGR